MFRSRTKSEAILECGILLTVYFATMLHPLIPPLLIGVGMVAWALKFGSSDESAGSQQPES